MFAIDMLCCKLAFLPVSFLRDECVFSCDPTEAQQNTSYCQIMSILPGPGEKEQNAWGENWFRREPSARCVTNQGLHKPALALQVIKVELCGFFFSLKKIFDFVKGEEERKREKREWRRMKRSNCCQTSLRAVHGLELMAPILLVARGSPALTYYCCITLPSSKEIGSACEFHHELFNSFFVL